ncbi:hypothetical protein D3C79_535340 [compost metagenome]
MYRSVSCFILFLAACSTENNPPGLRGVSGVPNNETFKLQFICAHEKIPKARNEIEVIFLYARWLQKSNQLKRDAKIYAEVERLYRISAEQGHYKANINLQNGSMRGYFKLRGAEHLRLSAELIEVKLATGYLFVGYFLEQGSAGLRKDPEMALRYTRKAADEGNAQAQYDIAEKLAPINIHPDIARQMRLCAAEQGHGKAAVALGVNLQTKGLYPEAVEAFQLGVAAGYEGAVGYLDEGYRGPASTDELHYLGLEKDLERAQRYNKIWRILSGYSYASPKVPEINDIVPLPPAKLPPWDGKLQWLEERLANVPPEKPSEALIQRLAKEKLLDPATGRPLSASPFVDHRWPKRSRRPRRTGPGKDATLTCTAPCADSTGRTD